MIVVLFQISARAWPLKTMNCKEAQLVVEWSFHNEPSRLINGFVSHSKLTFKSSEMSLLPEQNNSEN
jgi:hypothetical protein